MKGNKTEMLMWIIFALMGGVFLVIGTIASIGMFDYEGKIETTGVITSVDTYRDSDGDIHGTVFVKYDVDGNTYESWLNSYSSDFYEGKKIKIYYDEANPDEIGMKSMDFIFLIFPGMGLLFFLIGGIGIGVKINGKRSERKLKLYGRKVYAEYTQTILNTSYAVNGRNPYNIICTWDNPEDGQKYILKSKNLWFNPDGIIAERNITMFPVYINPENKKKYFIDTDIVSDKVVDLT